jgi:amino acid adenylation domain-containing protein/FkbM family methyltransferase
MEARMEQQDVCLHELIERGVSRSIDRIAVVSEEDRLTHGELDRRARQLAAHLRGLGAGPEVRVGLFVEPSVALIVGILGILKSGAAYVPIDTAYPRERIGFLLGDAGIRLLLTESHLLSNLPGAGEQTVCLDTFDWNASEQPAAAGPAVCPCNLAYVIYTSGSTGQPKGVGIEHRNIVNYVRGVSERLQLEDGMSYATVTTVAADLGNTVIFPALANGGTLHVISRERAKSQAMLSEYFSRERVDVLKIVPSHLAALQSGKHPEQIMPRRRLILGGESSRREWIDRLRDLAPACEIFNHYGPTETTVGVLTYRVDRDLPHTDSRTLPLGTPLPDSCVHVLDEAGQPVPPGVMGELCIGGRGVARGYLNRSELTAEKFVPDPFNAEPGARMYRTGDLARYLPDGNLEFCGRIDYQIKLHGNRIEPGEIEAALREQSGVRDALVVAADDGSGGKQLVAYVVPAQREQPLWHSSSVRVLPDGSSVCHLNRNETDYIYNEIFVLQSYLRHGITIRDGDCIVDAGANIGLFTVFANRLAQDLRVLAFEPNPAAFACLKANADAWGTHVTCLPVGLSHSDGLAELTFFEGLSLLSGFHADAATEREVVRTYVFNQQSELLDDDHSAADLGALIDDRMHATSVSARLRRLSAVLAEEGVERIDLLKINVEKSELDVLLGLDANDWLKIRQLVIEVDRLVNLGPIISLLKTHGYDVVVEQDPLLNRTELYYVYAIRPSAKQPGLNRDQAPNAHVRQVPAGKDVLTPATLRTSLKARLPQYMVPSAFVLMEKFPLTANGKIDRAALPAFSINGAQPSREVRGPRTDTEKAVAAIWAELLGIPSVGIDEDFFDLGGQSLVAIKVVARLSDMFAIDLPLRNLFERPSVAGLSEIIDGLLWVSTAGAPAVELRDREETTL